MALKIAIYEIIHLDWLLPLCELFDGLDYEVHFFTSYQFKKDLQEALPNCYAKFKWTFLEDGEKNAGLFIKAKKFFRSTSFDVVLLNSVDSKHAILFYILRTHLSSVVLNLHDVNNFFKKNHLFGMRSIIRQLGKQLLNRKIDAFLVNFVEMKNYISSKKLTSKPVFVLAPVFSKATNNEAPLKNFSVVIPGSLDIRRRDYELVLDAWERLGHKKANLILAGAPVGKYGDKIIKRALTLKNKGYNVTVFDSEIPELTFQKIISDATLVLSPLRIVTSIHDGIIEEYGLTKTSGNIYDAIRHGKPMLIPDGLCIPKAMEGSCIRFSDAAELQNILHHLFTTDTALGELSKAAYYNSLQYDFRSIRNDLVYLIKNMVKNKINT